MDGVPFGFNLGYGFSDRSSATENMVFYNGKAHKLEDVIFCIPTDMDGNDLFMEPWDIVSSDGRFDGAFIPIMDRSSLTDAKVIISDQHQVFGHFTGKVVLDDGTEIEVKDFLCFFEKVRNKY